MIGVGICGSFCSFAKTETVLKTLCTEGYELLPIFSEHTASLDTRFGTASHWRTVFSEICQHEPILTIPEAEPLGPSLPLDALLLCPCTGNTLAKIACGITDTTVTMAAKAHLRCGRPLVIALASNDALSGNLQNIARLTEKKNVYFVPLRQDDPDRKPYSLVCDFGAVLPTLREAMAGRQIRPMIVW